MGAFEITSPASTARRHPARADRLELLRMEADLQPGGSIERSHLLGGSPPAEIEPPPRTDALLRPLAEYEALVGGGW